eukprot:COSAG03_NODE_524_length_7177_cov_6.485872_1_plen_60_part_00
MKPAPCTSFPCTSTRSAQPPKETHTLPQWLANAHAKIAFTSKLRLRVREMERHAIIPPE